MTAEEMRKISDAVIKENYRKATEARKAGLPKIIEEIKKRASRGYTIYIAKGLIDVDALESLGYTVESHPIPHSKSNGWKISWGTNFPKHLQYLENLRDHVQTMLNTYNTDSDMR